MCDISVIIPIYNVEKYLEDCLNSLRIQKTNAEFICINDGSTDNSLEICKKYEQLDPRFKIINQNNQGPAHARNAGINIATGKYICFVDSDDYLEKDSLQQLYNIAIKNDADCVIHSANIISNTENKIPEWILNTINIKNKTINNFDPNQIFSLNGCKPFLWLHFIKTDIIKKNDLLINEKLTIGEDQAFEIAYLSHVNKIIFTNKKVYNYRLFRKNSIMETYSTRLIDKMWQHIEMLNTICNNNRKYGHKIDDVQLIRLTLDQMYWDFMNLLFRDQKIFSEKIMDILCSLKIEQNINKISMFEKIKYEQIRTVFDNRNNPQKMIDDLREYTQKLN